MFSSLREYIDKQEKLIIEDETKRSDLRNKVIEFFRTNKNVTSESFGEFAGDIGIEKSEVESVVYELMSEFWGEGLYEKNPVDPDSEELEMGIEVEMEHTTSPEMARRIALDHLAESANWKDPRYYTLLKEMENKAKNEEE